MKLSKLTLREYPNHLLFDSRVLYGQGSDAGGKESHQLEADMEHRVIYVDGGAQFIPFEMVAVGDVDRYPETQHIEKLKREGVPVPTGEELVERITGVPAGELGAIDRAAMGAAADILPKARTFNLEEWRCGNCQKTFPSAKAGYGHQRHCKGKLAG